MEITIKGSAKEIAALVLALQGQPNGKIKKLVSKVFNRFCDDYNMHSDEIDRLLAELATEESE